MRPSAGFMAAKPHTETAPQLYDWLLLSVIVAVGGSAFAMIRTSVETVPPVVVTVVRLWIGAVVLYVMMARAGRRLPPLFARNSKTVLHPEWVWMIVISIIGYVIPFFIFPWAQQFLESGLAGIYMAFMPIWTIGLAFFFAGESLAFRKLLGFAAGFVGVVILIGPGVIGSAASADILPQLAILLATLCYAAAAVITRRAPKIRPRIFATGTLIASAVLATPTLLFVDLHITGWSAASVANVIALGIFPTGIGGILLIILIQRTGAGFMALANYLTPLWAVAAGAILFDERLEITALLALAVILAGVAVSQSGRKIETQPVLGVGSGADRKADDENTPSRNR